jgi:hypothetical protein
MAAFIRRVREIRDVAGLTGKITFQSFRHGGFTVAGDADLSDADVNAVGAKTETTLDIAKAPWTSDAGRSRVCWMRDQSRNVCPLALLILST